jgi:NAD(P)-dependent dehydrogenase (short-subunit alcohol dehydrogenase family)
MSPPVAIVTGGSSGIGLALVQHLLSKQWKVVIADMQPPREALPEGAATLFLPTDISSWEQQAETFQKAYAWGGERLDFVALNAGIDDRDDIFNTLSHDVAKPPRRPNTKTFSVNITGTYVQPFNCFNSVTLTWRSSYYGVKLASHYMTIPPTAGSGKTKPGGKIVVTASGLGLFAAPGIPMYSASKHGLVGLVRALGRNRAATAAHVRVNAVCPAIVATAGLPPALIDNIPEDQITPMSTVLRGFDALADFDGVAKDDWVETGPSGDTVEANIQKLIWHYYPPQPQPPQAVAEAGVKDAAPAAAAAAPPPADKLDREKGALLVMAAYRDRNVKFALEGGDEST